MSFERVLQKRLSGYLNRSSLTRPQLSDTLKEIALLLPETVIFGGMIREFALGNARGFFSDIDLVTLSPRKELSDAVAKFAPVVNKFDGFRFVANAHRFDIWSLPDTWAFRQGIVTGSTFDDLLNTTFFNVDAAIFHLSTRELNFLNGYETWIQERVLDINLSENFRPENMIRRVMSLVIYRQMGLTNKLGDYVVKNYPGVFCSPIESLVLSQIKFHIETGSSNVFRFDPQRKLID